MSIASYQSIRASFVDTGLALPACFIDMLGQATREETPGCLVRRGGQFTLVSLIHPHAERLERPEFQAAAAKLYRQARAILQADVSKPRFPLRIWNFLPAIHHEFSTSLDRYRAFNLGRYEACAEWFGAEDFARALPTATGVGHRGDDLTLHVFAGTRPGTSVENPRQHAAYRYSARYGPRPPCFARATRIELPRPMLFIGGTASVRGEESLHPRDEHAQLRETFANISALVNAAGDSQSYEFAHARVYAPALRGNGISPELDDAIRGYFGSRCDIEFIRADICRAELLLEIEAVAQPRGEASQT